MWVNVAQSLTATQQLEWLSPLRRASSELLDACRALDALCANAPAPLLVDGIGKATRLAVRLVAPDCETAVRRVIAAVKQLMLAVAAFSADSPGLRPDLKRLSAALGDSTKRFAAATDDILVAAAVGVALPTAQLRAIVADLLNDAANVSDGIVAARELVEPLRLALIDATKELLKVVAGAAAVQQKESVQNKVEEQKKFQEEQKQQQQQQEKEEDEDEEEDDEEDEKENDETILQQTQEPAPAPIVVEQTTTSTTSTATSAIVDVTPAAVEVSTIDDAPSLLSPGVDIALTGTALVAPTAAAATVDDTVQVEEQSLTSQPSLVIVYQPVDDDEDDEEDELLLAIARQDDSKESAPITTTTTTTNITTTTTTSSTSTTAPLDSMEELPPPVPPMPDMDDLPPPAVPGTPPRVSRRKKHAKPRKRNLYNTVVMSLEESDALVTAHSTIERGVGVGDDGADDTEAAATSAASPRTLDEYGAIESRRLSMMLEKAVAAAAEAEVSAAIEPIDVMIDDADLSQLRERRATKPRGRAPEPRRDSETMRRQRDKVETMRAKEEQIMQLQSALSINKVEVARNREGGSSIGPKRDHVLARVIHKLKRRESSGHDRDGQAQSQQQAQQQQQQQQCKSVLARPLEPPILPGDIDAVNHRSRIFWMKPMVGSKLFEDLYRLARRVTLIERATGAVLFAAPHHADRSPLELLGDIFAIIASRVEVRARATDIAEAARGVALARAPTSTPAPLTIRRFVEKFVAFDSPTTLVLRSIEQAMVTPVMMWLKRRTRVLSKDVVTPDGWTVLVHLPVEGVADAVAPTVAPLKHELHPLCVAVTHVRKERALIDSAKEFFSISQSAQFVVDPVNRSLLYVSVRFPSVLYDATAALPPVRDALAVLAEWNAHCASFGVPLDRVCDREGRAVPSVLAHLGAYLCDAKRADDGLRTQGIFRQSAQRSEVLALAQRIDDGGVARIESASFGMHVLAGVLVHWLRSLPDPVIPTRTHGAIFALWSAFRNAPGENAGSVFRRDLGELLRARTSLAHRQTLVFVIGLFKRVVELHEHNLMDARNCAIILGPILMRPAASVVEDEMALVTAIHCANGIIEFLLSSQLELVQMTIGGQTQR